MDLEVTVAMPCLDEARTVGVCIEKARRALEALGARGEIVIADNGSRDGSAEIAARSGARVVHVDARGYGHACKAAVSAARGRYVVMGDADDSYDFGEMHRLLARLDAGADLVMGSRFRGHIVDGAMPWMNRYVGTPAMSRLVNHLFETGLTDVNCGLRALKRDIWPRLALRAGGMELASEMVIRAAREGLRIDEVPVTLHPGGRGRPPHLRPLRDGMRHLALMLAHANARFR
jgi:glycosyltransferase involved in cell wall biosynthesis